MKIKKYLLHITAVTTAVLLLSCASVGQHLPISQNEIVIGTIQTTFIARNAWLVKDETIGMHVYVRLLEAAADKYSCEIDVRDIVWVTGRKVSPLDTEISSTGKVIKDNTHD